MATDPLLAKAVVALSEHCDGAHSRDGVGYNGSDAKFGNSLATIPPEAWDANSQHQAWTMLHKYAAQLESVGIIYGDIPEPEVVEKAVNRGARAVDVRNGKVMVYLPYGDPGYPKTSLKATWNRDMRGWQVGVARYGHVLEWAAEHKVAVSERARELLLAIPKNQGVESIGTVTLNPHTKEMHLSFEYNTRVIDAVRALPGRHWDGPTKQWLVPAEYAKQIKEIAAEHHLTVAPEVMALEDHEIDLAPKLGVSGEDFTIQFNYDAQLLSLVRQMPGAKWQPLNKAWFVPVEAIEEVMGFVSQYKVKVSLQAQALIDESASVLEAVAASAAHDADITIPNFGSTKYQLFPFQRAGVAYAMKRMGYEYIDGEWVLVTPTKGGVLIGDEMGLGKTSQALGVLRASNSFPAVVICPAVVKENWAREIKNWMPDLKVQVIYGTSGDLDGGLFGDPDVYVINYDVLGYWINKFPPLKAMVLDESHYIKNGATIRAKDCIRLSDMLDEFGAVRLCLSGTPILNRPTEIMTQLRVIARLEEFGGPTKFRNEFAKSTSRALAALNRKLRATCYVRRRKIDVLTELPPKMWATLYMHGDPTVMVEYRKAEEDLINYLADLAMRLALESGATTEEAREAAWRKAMRAQAAEALVAISVLKQLAAKAKMTEAKQWIEDFLENDKKLVAFGWHRAVVDDIAVRFANGVKIQGGQDPKVREANKDKFQEDDEQKVISCNIKAAGVGITLTAASDVIFLEQGWTPGDMDQAVDRCHRIGQTDSVTGWLALVENTIDIDIANLIDAKRDVVNRATDGVILDEDENEEIRSNIQGDLLIHLAERGLAQRQLVTA